MKYRKINQTQEPVERRFCGFRHLMVVYDGRIPVCLTDQGHRPVFYPGRRTTPGFIACMATDEGP